MTSETTTMVNHGKLVGITKKLYHPIWCSCSKGSCYFHFYRHGSGFYVKTLGKSGVNLQFYTLRTHDGTMWWSWAFPSRIVVLGLHDIVTWDIFTFTEYRVLMKCLVMRLGGYESCLTPNSHTFARSSGAAPSASLLQGSCHRMIEVHIESFRSWWEI